MSMPTIKTNYGYETLLDPDGVNTIINNMRAINALIEGHMVSGIFNHKSVGIMTESGERLFTVLANLLFTYEYFEGQADGLLSKSKKLIYDMILLVENLNKNKVLTINGKSGNLRILGAGEIVVGTAPADNNIIINNTLSSEVLSE